VAFTPSRQPKRPSLSLDYSWFGQAVIDLCPGNGAAARPDRGPAVMAWAGEMLVWLPLLLRR
jgi:hypothetical protein